MRKPARPWGRVAGRLQARELEPREVSANGLGLADGAPPVNRLDFP